MIRIMVVDDEKITRDGMAYGIEWNSYGINMVGCAENGMEALYLIRELEPDIVLSDIRMPVMDGLALARRLSEEMPSVRLIIFSAFREFEYAQKAMTFGVEDYLLKPLHEAEVVRRVLEVCKKLEFNHAMELKNNLDFLLLSKDNPFMEDYQRLEAELFLAFERRQEKLVAELLGQIGALFSSQTDSKIYQSVCLRQLVKFREVMAKWDLGGELANIDALAENELYRFRDMHRILEWQTKKAREFINMARLSKGGKHAGLVLRAEHYVAEHYPEDISLCDVADMLAISPAYLSRIFRMERGTSFVEWLNLCRIGKAKELLSGSQELITNVASLTGYNDYKYFSNVFKKYTGLSPREYRKGINER